MKDRREMVRMAAELLILGFVFLVLVPLTAVMLFGEKGQAEPDLSDLSDLSDLGFSNRIKTPDTIEVWQEEKNKMVKVDFEAYICRVVASEMPGTFEEEALKAQSVAARTFAMAKIEKYKENRPQSHPDAPICNTTHCQVYKTEKALIACHEEGWEKEGWKKIQKACRATEGQMLYYDGELVMQPLFFSSSGGQTENSEDVFVGAYPYLVSVSSPYEENASHRDEETKISIADFGEKLKAAYPEKNLGSISRSSVKILSRTAGGRVEEMQVGDGADGVLKGTEVRMALGLSSALFAVDFNGENIVFTSSGSGHGVGLSQYGADGMAKKGYDYKEILTHYYSGTEVH